MIAFALRTCTFLAGAKESPPSIVELLLWGHLSSDMALWFRRLRKLWSFVHFVNVAIKCLQKNLSERDSGSTWEVWLRDHSEADD